MRVYQAAPKAFAHYVETYLKNTAPKTANEFIRLAESLFEKYKKGEL